MQTRLIPRMCPVYNDKSFTNKRIHVCCKKMLGGGGQKFPSDTKVQFQSFVSGLDSSQHGSLSRTFSSLLTP